MGMMALLRGPKGDDGDAGAAGAKGDQGDAGAKGDQGDAGAAGADGYQLVARAEQTGYDKSIGDFTTNAAWHDLDLSAIVPANAIAVLLKLYLISTEANSYFSFRKNGNTNVYNTVTMNVPVLGISDNDTLLVFCDANRVIEYCGKNVTWTNIDLLVLGWLLPAT